MRRRKGNIDIYLLNCELYDEERDTLRRSVGVQGMRSSVLVTGKQTNNKGNCGGIYRKKGPVQAQLEIIYGSYSEKKPLHEKKHTLITSSETSIISCLDCVAIAVELHATINENATTIYCMDSKVKNRALFTQQILLYHFNIATTFGKLRI